MDILKDFIMLNGLLIMYFAAAALIAYPILKYLGRKHGLDLFSWEDEDSE